MHVLIVDDNDIDCLITISFVEKAGMNAITVNNATKALEITSKRDTTPDIIVVDWMMPEVNGLELCQKIRALNLTITPYIIMVTSNSLGQIEQTALEVGADDFVEKPIHGAVFIARLKVGARIVAMQKKLLSLADTDELTGLLNRRAAIKACEIHLARLARSDKPVSHCLIIADIDFFKNINDTYGHQIGDRVLNDVSNRMRNSIRPFETAARFGGEEFLVYCEATETEASIILNRMRQAISSSQYSYNGISINVTMSFGCVVINKRDAKHNINEFIKKADDLLYEVKNQGRNNFKVAPYSDVDNNK
ncbi:MAG TPA: diguanylate cyclase [Methylophaga aminisulfidivorans]|jgi:diguanylate cyclase (GGDEF)-like protein|uniref:GGDEF domain-containing response regulator n=1 Tax=Methylophaga TaxID=40222 RepID=UPI0017752543|nr:MULTISPECIES: diguanylate cyclase [Methylophaga]HIC47040.1 diguanylate cyclase [Methylophaga sp.]HIM39570.1 diguanylate cyclase [Methylophaga aminisulfidivorans]